MDEIVSWIVHHLDFDALYYYGRDRALHLSWGRTPRKLVVLMRTDPETGRRRPAGSATGEKGRALISRAIGGTGYGGALDART
jgi:hypothetical protein